MAALDRRLRLDRRGAPAAADTGAARLGDLIDSRPGAPPPAPPQGGNANDAIAAAQAALARGDLITGYDLAQAALAEQPDELAAYLLVLALARLGDLTAACEHYAALGLDKSVQPDTRALGARLAKDAAALATGSDKPVAYAAASAAYAEIHTATGDVFPGVNAASLAYLAGQVEAAQAQAGELVGQLGEPNDYWLAATLAEALLLLGRDAEAEAAMRAALVLPGSNAGARSSTLRQFELLAAAGIDAGGKVRAVLRPPATIFFCGHMFLADPAIEAELATRIGTALAEHDVGIGYGALACGTDIVVAEQLLARGGELNVVLPFEAADFVPFSVDPGGAVWRARFDACLAAAASVHIVSNIGYIGDPQALSHASAVAMGLTRLRSRQHAGTAALLAVWDGAASRGVAGTAVDIAAWRGAGGSAVIIDAAGLNRKIDRPKLPDAYDGPPRAVMSIVFADVPGFTGLAEVDLPRFWRDVMGRVAAVLDSHAASVRSRNTWGDAIFAVIDDSAVAAEIVLTVQEQLAAVGTGASLRVAVHHGGVFATADPITHQPTYYGREITRAARIEPVTPPGQVYVTESFAAALAMSAPGRFACRYVGKVALAKNYGVLPMYRLVRC